MRVEGRGRSQVDLFNFSFLDVLACTIGLLIFIMAIIAITSGSAGNQQAAAQLGKIKQKLVAAQAKLTQAHATEAAYAHLLARRARATLNPKGADAHIRREIVTLQRETADFNKLALQAQAKITAAKKTLATAQRKNSPSKAQKLQEQISLTQQQLAVARKKVAALAKTRKAHTVRYYIPYVRKTSNRQTVFFEVAKNRIWPLTATDFHIKTILFGNQIYTRRAGAVPDTLARLISPRHIPAVLRRHRPRNTLLIFLVRPSGFGTCRALEFWARTHHYAVNWYPNGHKQTFVFQMVNSVQRQ